ncbi:PepSY domain-containing protein [Methylomonas fluvii]|uniref:PepSY domain-containing protein n=1 Tax=Methylomonas fluvii TaxID=1854564 RepID=A0ABR9DJH3_9GAMM|nr:PepSY domain-containing protein [Methylomonas fluvii]MBD9362981.1 PepSY domain-containing protein [Methylomonas fluvii]
MKKSLNWLLYETHRWLGVVLALFVFFWFFTGIAIIYSTPTTQSRSQQLAHAESLAPEAGWLSLGEAWERSAEQRKLFVAQHQSKPANMGEHGAQAKTEAGNGAEAAVGIADARLVRQNDEPFWLVEDTKGARFALSALDGSLRETSVEQALRIADDWFKREGINQNLQVVETVEAPIILRNQDALRPFHRVASDDGDELLISARTGEVLHASTRIDRAFYYAGNWLHLFKPLEAIGLGQYRHDVQLWSGLGATIACITGLIIGWLRWRPGFNGKPTYSQGRTQPYREFWFKWHFWSGLIGGTVALSWALSGFIDTNPGKLFSEANPSRQELNRYLGKVLPDAMRNWQPGPLNTAEGKDIVELAWRRLGSEAVLLAYGRDGQRLPQAVDGAVQQFNKISVTEAIQRVAEDTPIASQELLDDYDSYYYPRHNQSLVEKPLPVVSVQLADEAGTRFYLDPQDGSLLAKLDRSRRVFRWLYSGLHHWDFGWLYHRPIWDAWMLTWVGFGLVLGASSLVVGWKRLVKTFKPKKRKATGPQSVLELATETRS